MLITKSVLVGFFSAALLLQGGTGYKVVGRYPVPGVGGFDYVTLDDAARRIYAQRGSDHGRRNRQKRVLCLHFLSSGAGAKRFTTMQQ